MSKADIMQLVCPGCGCFGSMETFATHADAAVVGALLGAMPPDVSAAMQRYVRLFAPEKHEMTWRRARRVLEPLVPLIQAQQINVRGRDWPAPPGAWIAAVNGMLDSRTLKLPLKSNGYPFSVLAGDAEARAERAANEGARNTGRPASPGDGEAQAARASQIRTATAMLVTYATVERTRFKTEVSEQDARGFLAQRGFGIDVAGPAIAEWQRSRK